MYLSYNKKNTWLYKLLSYFIKDYLNDVEEGKRLQCPDCDVTFDHDFDLKSHFVQTHLKVFGDGSHFYGLRYIIVFFFFYNSYVF